MIVLMAFDNPYRPAPGSEPPLLAGRAGEQSTAEIATEMTRNGAPAQPVIFTGLRGMGKTALLRRGASDAASRGGLVLAAEASRDMRLTAVIHRELERAQRDVASIPKRLRTALASTLRALPKTTFELPHDAGSLELSAPVPPTDAPLEEALDLLNEATRAHDRFLVLALDEIQDAPLDDLLVVVRLVHRTAGTASPVLLLGAGLPDSAARLHRVRTYTERWRYPRLGLLPPHETRRAIEEPARERNVAIDEDALALLVAETGGYPFFIQEYATAAWLVRRDERITRAGVETIVPGVRRTLDESFYEARFARLTPRECRYALALDALGDGAHSVAEIADRLGMRSEALSSTRNQLLKKDVAFSPSAGLLEFRMPLTRRYVETHRDALARRAAILR